jgi:hypothetical protein
MVLHRPFELAAVIRKDRGALQKLPPFAAVSKSGAGQFDWALLFSRVRQFDSGAPSQVRDGAM